ncbi:MerR family transcriptional regulator [Priestia megaterium]|uniref:MerR family transcriptional regulator n=1 Tax=Priestia megaterium TaxID=1404 RepID=UPI00389AB351
MTYTISQVAKKLNVTIYTIRYYDKEGLFPFLDRTASGNRIFKEQDIEWIDLICCLKSTGMQIKDIRTLIENCTLENAVLHKSLQMLMDHKKAVQKEIEEIYHKLETIDYKIKHLPEMYERIVNKPSN